MNGVAEIKITKGDLKGTYKLRYGMIGCMEFEVRSFNNPALNNGKVLTDLIYAGIFGEAARAEKPIPLYADVVDLLDELAYEDDYSDQIGRVWETYHTSKWGQDFQKKIDELTKKKEQSELLNV